SSIPSPARERSAGSPRPWDASGSAWSAIRAWPGSRRVGSSSDASGPAHLANLEAEQLRLLNGAFVCRDQTAVGRDVERVLVVRRAPERARRGAGGWFGLRRSSVSRTDQRPGLRTSMARIRPSGFRTPAVVAIRVERTTVHEDRVGQIGPVLNRTIGADLPFIARALAKGPTRSGRSWQSCRL